jgi:peptidoglycan/xylan/chitin deacetylase (PgdA/CDA1 family)
MSIKPKKKTLLRLLPGNWVVVRGPDRDKTLYLSFDDGPHPEHTPALLDLLREHGVQASFFLIGREAERFPSLTARIAAEGHAIGNHSYSHPRFAALGVDAQLEEIERCDHVLAGFDGRERHAFRPPRGELSPRLLWHCMRRRQPIVYWSLDSLDYQKRPADDLAGEIESKRPRAGEIMLMHDDADCARSMLETLLPRWRDRGFRFAALPVMGLV